MVADQDEQQQSRDHDVVKEAAAAFAQSVLEAGMDYETAIKIAKTTVVNAALHKHNGNKHAAGRTLKINRDYVRTLARREI